MPNTYTQIHVQFVFAVKNRYALIAESWRVPLQKYMTGITTNCGHRMLAIYAMPDHVHLLVGFNGDQSVSQFMRTLKSESSKWIKEQRFVSGTFQWQEGYGAFSYSRCSLPRLYDYINNQEERHKILKFPEEYVALLKEFEIDFNPKYLFADPS